MEYVFSYGRANAAIATPSFVAFKNVLTGADVAPPVISPISDTGAFRFTWNTQGSPDIFWQVDGGAALGPDRYREGLINGNDAYIDAVKAKTDLIPNDFPTVLSNHSAALTRLLGLTKENSVLDQTMFDVRNNLTSGRLRIFGSRADALAGLSPLAIYTITATYAEGTTNITSYSMVRES